MNESLGTKKEVITILKGHGIISKFGHSNFAYKQRDINTYQAIKNTLEISGWVSIVWTKIPKKHLKAVNELVKGLLHYTVLEISSDYTTVPLHSLYIKTNNLIENGDFELNIYNWTSKRIVEHINKLKRRVNELKWSGEGYSHVLRELEGFKKARGVK